MRRRGGYSMGELIVAMAVFSMVAAVSAELLIHGLRSTAAGERRQTALDEGRNVLYRLSDELRQADAVLDPPRNRLLVDGASYLVMSTAEGVIGYRLVSSGTYWNPEWRVQRVVYYPGYTAGITGTQIVQSARTLTTAPSTLRFSIDTEGGLPPGQGGTTTGPGTGLALALGTQKDTIQVELSITPYEATAMTMRTKKTVWAGLFPSPGANGQ